MSNEFNKPRQERRKVQDIFAQLAVLPNIDQAKTPINGTEKMILFIPNGRAGYNWKFITMTELTGLFGGGGGSDHLVLMTAGDPSADYVGNKLSAGRGMVVSVGTSFATFNKVDVYNHIGIHKNTSSNAVTLAGMLAGLGTIPTMNNGEIFEVEIIIDILVEPTVSHTFAIGNADIALNSVTIPNGDGLDRVILTLSLYRLDNTHFNSTSKVEVYNNLGAGLLSLVSTQMTNQVIDSVAAPAYTVSLASATAGDRDTFQVTRLTEKLWTKAS